MDKTTFAFADLEASNAANASIPSTPAQHIKTIHRINSYAYFLHIDPDLHYFPYEDFSERIYLQHFPDDTEEAERELISCFMRDHTDQEKMVKELKSKHLLEYTENNTCIYCGEETSDTKVFDHDHYRNKYNGPAHALCNLRAQKQKEIPIFFHNATYDENLILKYIGSKEMFGAEHYWKLAMVGQQVKFVCADIIFD